MWQIDNYFGKTSEAWPQIHTCFLRTKTKTSEKANWNYERASYHVRAFLHLERKEKSLMIVFDIAPGQISKFWGFVPSTLITPAFKDLRMAWGWIFPLIVSRPLYAKAVRPVQYCWWCESCVWSDEWWFRWPTRVPIFSQLTRLWSLKKDKERKVFLTNETIFLPFNFVSIADKLTDPW